MSIPADPRRALLRNRDFAFFLSARFLATLAVQMQTVAVGWQVYEVTRDPLDLGLIGLSGRNRGRGMLPRPMDAITRGAAA